MLIDDGERTQLLSLGQGKTSFRAPCSTAIHGGDGEHLFAAMSLADLSSPIAAPLNRKLVLW
jgi:hypothetical protein